MTLNEPPDADKIEVADVDELIRWIQHDPEIAWKILCNRMKEIGDLKDQISALTADHLDEITDLREQIVTMTARESSST